MGTPRSSWATAVTKNRLDGKSRKSKKWICFLLGVCFSMPATAQQSANQRSFFTSSSEISGAIVKIGATTKGRLPTLEGFVHQPGQPIERYSKGYFECTFQMLPPVDGSITVRVVAKVSAWYTDPDPAQSGYRVLASNGRLESDALDRLAEVLPANASDGSPSRTPAPSPSSGVNVPAYSYHSSPAPSAPSLSLNPRPSALSSSSRPATPAPAPGSNLDIVKSNRSADEKKAADLKTYVSNMEEIQRNQAHPNDLAAIKKSKSPIYAKPSETAQVLMHADAQDEFQVLGLNGPWVHIQISGASRGWIQRAQLEMPPGFAQAAEDSAAPTSPFKVSKEETASFHGDWARLKGKSVRIEWVEPATPSLLTSRKDKLAFAKSVFLNASEKLPASPQTPEGIVVVFDSIDGGQIAAALPSVQALANHSLSDAAFWHECSIEPAESFLDKTSP
jgi:hypothetical protein